MKKTEFEFYMDRYKDNIYAIALNYMRNPSDANDVVQNTFLKLFCTFRRFESEDHVRNWLIRVAINECNKAAGKRKAEAQVPFEEYMEQFTFEMEEESELFGCVMQLPEKYRLVVHLYYYESYSTKEIADILKVTDAVVRQRLSRARGLLKGKLSGQ